MGRRKNAIATVRLYRNGQGEIIINGKPFSKYFTYLEMQRIVTDSLTAVGLNGKVDATVKVLGGGVRGQAESIRHAITRALVKIDASYRSTLKPLGFLKRDPRVKERKKFGLKKARRAPQWQKR